MSYVKFLCCIILLLFLSCSLEKSAEVGSQKPPETKSNAIPETSQPYVSMSNKSYLLEINPKEAFRNNTLYLISRGFNLSDAKIEWLLNGNLTISPIPNQFKTTETKKGDRIQAKAIIQDRQILSNIVEIKNSPPEISEVKFLPGAFKQGPTMSIDVSASDIDEDAVTILYEWTKNGEPAGNSKKIEVPLKRGDKIFIKITPFDGEAYGHPVVLNREIQNMPPMILEDKKFNFDEKVYTYQLRATDPDGDSLTFSLKFAPPGMSINPTTGLIQWNVPPDFKGKTSFTAAVTDGHGGEAVQDLTLEITPEQKIEK